MSFSFSCVSKGKLLIKKIKQGSIYVFVLLIFTYVLIMNRLDRRYGVEED